jgi:hypothetical protein
MGVKSKYHEYLGDIQEEHRKGHNHSQSARIVFKNLDLGRFFDENDFINWGRKALVRFVKKEENPQDNIEKESSENEKPEEKRQSSKEAFMPSAWNDAENKFYSLDEYCDKYNLPKDLAVGARLIAHQAGHMIYNIGFKNFTPGESVVNIQDVIEQAVERHINPIAKEITGLIDRSHDFTRVVYTDVHIGMNPNDDGRSLYGGAWNEEELFSRLDKLADEILINSCGRTLFVDELGDFLDGWNGETARGGHKLPQNMDNRMQFDLGVKFKVMLAEKLANHFDSITFNNICMDNHASDFGYMANQTSKHIIEAKFSNVKVINHEKFINHYYVGKHAFVISHGKDDKNLKFGFKPVLDPKQIEKIDQYCKENDIYKHSEFIEFSKGDSHQMLLDFCTSSDFDYFNYPAFSPSSNWVQTNFKKGRSGFVIQNGFVDIREKDFVPIFFDWKK